MPDRTGLDTDFSITDAYKRIKKHKAKRDQMLRDTNNIDALNDRINNGEEPDSVRRIFED
jgi:hypothetical protein